LLIGIDRQLREAHEFALDKEDGWSSAGENSDGGVPAPFTESRPLKTKNITDARLFDPKKPVRSYDNQTNYIQPQGSWDGQARLAPYTAQGVNARLTERAQASSWRASSSNTPQVNDDYKMPEAQIDGPISSHHIQRTALSAAAKPFVLNSKTLSGDRSPVSSLIEESSTTGPNHAMTSAYQELADNMKNSSIDEKPKATVRSGEVDEYGWPIYHLE
jgi:hypothetical protein